MDWCLVEVNSDRFGANFPPDYHAVRPQQEHQPQGSPYKPSVIPVTKISDITEGDWVVMKGRTSGVTSGIIHKIRTEINGWKTRNLKSSETIIIHTNDGKHHSFVFRQDGDSGAWIFDRDGALVGQQIAHRNRNVDYPDLYGHDTDERPCQRHRVYDCRKVTTSHWQLNKSAPQSPAALIVSITYNSCLRNVCF